MRAAIAQPPISIGGNVLQRGRVVTCHLPVWQKVITRSLKNGSNASELSPVGRAVNPVPACPRRHAAP